LVKPLSVQPSPPPLAANYPETDRPSNSHLGAPMETLFPAKATACTHRIVDGDTLAALAQRYLGSPARAREIFDANRNVLSDPELLPIGAELKIPPTEPPK
jgi:nucleoid-associated protein YgaU